MSEPSTAERLPVLVQDRGRMWAWTPERGLDVAIARTVDPWIWRQANHLSYPAKRAGLSLEDLVQEGRLAAIEAARTFVPRKDATYMHWATFTIKRYLLRAIRRMEVSMSEKSWVRARLTGTLPTLVPIDAPVPGDAKGRTMAEFLPDSVVPQDNLVVADTYACLHEALRSLRPRDREVLLRRYGFGGPEEPLADIARSWGLSRERVRQVEVQAQVRLRLILARRGLKW